MKLKELESKFAASNQLQEWVKATTNNSQISPKIHLTNYLGSGLSFLVASYFKTTEQQLLIVLNDKEEAAYYLNDLEALMNDKQVLFYPASYRRPYQIEETDNANILLRSEVLNRLNSKKKPSIILTYPEALVEKVVTKKTLDKKTLKLSVGEEVSSDFINEVLFEYQFKRVDFVSEPGEFSVRGGIIDVFSFSNNQPYRIEFFGDEVDSIRCFDVETQLSTITKKKVSIMPNMESKASEEVRESFISYISASTHILIKDVFLVKDQLQQLFKKAEDAYAKLNKGVVRISPKELFYSETTFTKDVTAFTVTEFGSKPFFKDAIGIQGNQSPQPSFNKKFELLHENLSDFKSKDYSISIACVSDPQAKRLKDIFTDQEWEVNFSTLVNPLYQGFIDHDLKWVCYTDHQLFERYHKFHLKNSFDKKQALTLKELTSLEIGDYVTHIDHGIGKFAGLQKIDVEGKMQEAIKLVYGERDILYLSIHSLHKISKFNGKEGKPPKIYKLGSKAWKVLKQKTKTKVKQIAFDLIKLYAKRRLEKGFAFAPDSYLQHELEASFIYEDTPDQSTATEAVKKDMESEQPMDRLVCGDVGFGKTEVAIRAAFKAVDNNKQVAILVPTTILAFQHHRSFEERLKDFPVRVDYLNRFRTSKEKKLVLEDLERGKIDILIGTHQLVNKNVKFRDLGLLVIDEEQKFGVAVKDKLKLIKENVDTLTLTATPIPRTLQFSLMAARDLSTIKTPPPNRYPIETHVIRFSEELIRDAISYEVQRGGQVFFINNRIENIKEVAGMIQRLVPNAKVGVGHGQLDGKKLEQLMLSFMNNEFDVLVATTIIESGLDVTNANTIFINNANNFGISDLHQMRGRVGRSNKKAFCYLITPPPSVMTSDAQKRINALEQFSDLGSGFEIAMKDLEIRGAGDLLGGEQSGFINEIGFDTYQKILNEAIEELKENEFKDLYEEELNASPKVFVKETQIDTDIEILFPDDYVNNIKERLYLYTKLNELDEEEQLQTFTNELVDRFGPLPKSVVDLLDSVRVKWMASSIGFEKIVLKSGKMIAYFVADQQSVYYQSENFRNVIHYLQRNPSEVTMKEKQTRNGLKLLFTISEAKTIQKVKQVFEQILFQAEELKK